MDHGTSALLYEFIHYLQSINGVTSNTVDFHHMNDVPFSDKSELNLPPMDADELSFYVNFISVKNVELCGGFATQSMFI